MYRYVIKRILMLIPVIIGVSFLVYFIMDLAAGDAADLLATDDMTDEDVEQLREELGLNDPLLVRYGRYMWNLLHGDMGYSYISDEPVMDMFIKRFPNTLKLALGCTAIAALLSIPLGVFAAVHHGKLVDNIATVLAMLGLAMPNFWFGLLMILVFSLKLGWLPSMGDDYWYSIILPGLTIAVDKMATLTRTTRSSVLDVLNADYLRTARSKGVGEKIVITKHALRNALLPILQKVGASFAGSLGGAALTETVFAWPGVGRLIVTSISSRDTNVVTGCIIMKTICISLVLLIVDILYAYVDPRIKSHYVRGGKKKHG